MFKKLDVQVQPQAMKVLLAHFAPNGREINYVKFCDAIDDTFEYLAMTRKDPTIHVKQTCEPVRYDAQTVQNVQKKV